MENGLRTNFIENAANAFAIAHVNLKQSHVRGQVGGPSAAQVIENGNPMASSQKRVDNMTPNKSRPASHQHLHGNPFD